MNYLEAGLMVGFKIPWTWWLNEEEIELVCIIVGKNGVQFVAKAHLSITFSVSSYFGVFIVSYQ